MILNKLLFKCYRFIFSENPSEGFKKFFLDLNYIAVGYGLSSVFAFISQVLMGRFLGPDGYGNYALVQSVAIFLYLPMSLGITTALVKYNAEENEITEQKKIISTSFLAVFVLSIVLSFSFLFFADKISALFGVSSRVFNFAIFLAFFNTINLVAVDTIRSLHKMKTLSIFQFFDGLLMLVLILYLILTDNFYFETVIFVAYATYIVLSLFIFFNVRKYLIFDLDWILAKKLLKYGVYSMIGAITCVFLLSFNKLIINRYLEITDVGIYNAYYLAATGILGVLWGIFITVFFPTASKHRDKKTILEKINKFLPFFFFLGIPLFMITGFLILNLYGKKYPMDFLLLLEFVIVALLIISYGFYDWLFASYSDKGVKFMASLGTILVLVHAILSLFLTPLFGLHGAIISLGGAYILGIFLYRFLQNKVLRAGVA